MRPTANRAAPPLDEEQLEAARALAALHQAVARTGGWLRDSTPMPRTSSSTPAPRPLEARTAAGRR